MSSQTKPWGEAVEEDGEDVFLLNDVADAKHGIGQVRIPARGPGSSAGARPVGMGGRVIGGTETPRGHPSANKTPGAGWTFRAVSGIRVDRGSTCASAPDLGCQVSRIGWMSGRELAALIA